MTIVSTAMRVCGFLYLFILGTNATSVALGNRVDEKQEEAVDKLEQINLNPKKFKQSIWIAIISHSSILLIAGMLYIAFNQHNQLLAIIGTTFRLGEGFTLIFNEFKSLPLFNMAHKYYIADNIEKKSFIDSSGLIIQKKNFRFIFGLNLLSIGALSYCILFLSSGAVPVLIAGLGSAASLLSFFGTGLVLAKPNLDLVYKIGLPLMMLFEVIFGFWLLFQ